MLWRGIPRKNGHFLSILGRGLARQTVAARFLPGLPPCRLLREQSAPFFLFVVPVNTARNLVCGPFARTRGLGRAVPKVPKAPRSGLRQAFCHFWHPGTPCPRRKNRTAKRKSVHGYTCSRCHLGRPALEVPIAYGCQFVTLIPRNKINLPNQARLSHAPHFRQTRAYRISHNDATIEALGKILSENRNGVIVERDELMGLRSRGPKGPKASLQGRQRPSGPSEPPDPGWILRKFPPESPFM